MRITHAILLAVWAILVAPSLLWWENSITWVIFMSIYAIIAMHALALQSAIAARKQRRLTVENGSAGNDSEQ